MRFLTFLPFVTAVLTAACGDSSPVPEATAVALPVPTAGAAAGPRLSGDADTGIVLSWMEPGPDGAALRFSRFTAGAWTLPVTVTEGRDMFVNWADMPMVMPLGSGRMGAHWLEKSGEATYAYDVVYVQSADGGTSWSDPIRPHDDGTETEHGFVSMFADGDRTGLIWLDGRKMVNEVDMNDPVASSMTLRAAFIDADAKIHDEQLVDDMICECCQTDIAVAATGPVAVYRDRSAAEIRNIFASRYVDGAWLPGVPVADDNWEIHGCPVNGPAIAASGSTVVVTWFTGADQTATVKTAWSDDGGATFGEPIEVAGGNNLGRVGLALLDESQVVATWFEPGGKVQARTVGADGSLGAVYTVSETAAAFSVPQVARVGENLLFVWSENQDGEGRLASALVPEFMLN